MLPSANALQYFRKFSGMLLQLMFGSDEQSCSVSKHKRDPVGLLEGGGDGSPAICGLGRRLKRPRDVDRVRAGSDEVAPAVVFVDGLRATEALAIEHIGVVEAIYQPGDGVELDGHGTEDQLRR